MDIDNLTVKEIRRIQSLLKPDSSSESGQALEF